MTVTREKLFEEVWAEPMTTVAARYKVSSSYLARICRQLKVPHPGRGHWAKIEVGKGSKPPALPVAGPGDELEWSRDGEARRVPLVLPSLLTVSSSDRRGRKRRVTTHGLILGAREHFLKVRENSYGDFPKPTKRILVDLVVSKDGVDRALSVANNMFLALEERGFPVRLVPYTEQWRRPEVDPREGKRAANHRPDCWSPDRPTFVYVGTVAIGLTLFELTEEAWFDHIGGKSVRLSEAAAAKKRLHSYVSTSHVPSGKFVFRAYSPYAGTTWVKEWRETKRGDLSARLDQIGEDLLLAAPVILEQVKEEEQRAEIRRQKWEEENRRWEREQEERRRKEVEQRRVQARKDSFNQLVGIIDDWSFARRMEDFFAKAAADAAALQEGEREVVEERLARAKAMFGGIEPLPHFRGWRTPEER